MSRRPSPIVRTILVVIVCVLVAIGVSRAGVLLIESKPIANPDAIVVLASHEWERLPEAAHAARGQRAIVLLTEPVTPNGYNCYQCGRRRQWLASLGVPPTRVTILPHRVKNTYDEAIATREYMLAHRYHRLLVVTSPYHTRRALATFDHVFKGSAVSIGIAPAREAPAHPDAWWWWHPYDRWYVSYEWAGIAWYAVRHQVLAT